jgi:hypothetical protein
MEKGVALLKIGSKSLKIHFKFTAEQLARLGSGGGR